MPQFHAHLSDDESLNTIYVMTHLNALVYFAFNSGENSTISAASTDVDPSEQTQSGLFLECDTTDNAGRALPESIISPWGKWTITRGGYFTSAIVIEELWGGFFGRGVQARLVRDRGGSGYGMYGALYAIDAVERMPQLQQPVMAEEQDHMPYDTACEYWQRLWQHAVGL